MDICTEISTSELIMTGSGWRPRAAVSVRISPLEPMARPLVGSRPVDSYALCPQGAQLSVRTDHGAGNVTTKQHQFDVMGSDIADDFGTRWGSRPGRPPE